MTPAEIRQIIREELAAFFAAEKQPTAGQVISLERRMEIKRQAQQAIAAKGR